MSIINEILIKNIINKKNKIILLDFWADWCVSCKIFYKIIDELKKKYKKKITILKINIEYNKYILEKYIINNVPAVIIIKNKKILFKKYGFLSKEYMDKIINKVL